MEGISRDRFQDAADVTARPRLPVHVVLDNLRSAFNVGSILRTSDAARVARLHLCGITVRPPHRQLARTALGATRHVPWTPHSDAASAVSELRTRGMRVVALEITASSRSYLEVDLTPPLGLVLGHEVNGVSPDALAQCDEVVHIPMYGVKNSLNVATSFGVLIFEILRRSGDPSAWAGSDCT